MVLKNKKKQKQLETNNNTGDLGEDYISNLPDALIHHILSFLPTKHALSTCILSKRWKYVAISIPVLDFRHWRSKKNRKLETKLFMNFMDSLLFLHENPTIQEFHLDLDEVPDAFRVYGWISTIMKRKIEILSLCIYCSSTSSIFPLSFFTCDSLTSLDLDLDLGVWSAGKLIIPNAVSFPKLKILRLGSLTFVDEISTRKLFSNCPILEELRLSRCLVCEGLCIVNPSLKHLSIDSCELRELSLKIFAPNLLTISYTGDPPADFVLDSFPSLVEADVSFYIAKGEYSKEKFVKLFKALATVKVLKVLEDTFLVLTEGDIRLTDLPAFNNLIHLEGRSRFYCKSFGSDFVSIMRRFFRFLQLSPNLESIVFAEGIHFPDVEDDDCWSLDPNCSLPNLKSIKFKNFVGEPVEVNAIEVFLKYPGFLGIVTIVASSRLSKKRQVDLKKLVRSVPKPSNCVVKFLMSSEDT